MEIKLFGLITPEISSLSTTISRQKKESELSEREKPVDIVTGNHEKTIVDGVISLKGKQLFRQQEREVKKVGEFIIIGDRAI